MNFKNEWPNWDGWDNTTCAQLKSKLTRTKSIANGSKQWSIAIVNMHYAYDIIVMEIFISAVIIPSINRSFTIFFALLQMENTFSRYFNSLDDFAKFLVTFRKAQWIPGHVPCFRNESCHTNGTLNPHLFAHFTCRHSTENKWISIVLTAPFTLMPRSRRGLSSVRRNTIASSTKMIVDTRRSQWWFQFAPSKLWILWCTQWVVNWMNSLRSAHFSFVCWYSALARMFWPRHT